MRVVNVCAGLGLTLVWAGLAIACGPGPAPCTPPHCPFTAQQAMALPDSQIYYPGSTVVSRTATSGSDDVNGEPEDAYVKTLLNAPSTESEVAAWYEKTLVDAGWRDIESYVGEGGHGFHAFARQAPGPPAEEVMNLDFRYLQSPPTGTAYQLTFGVATP